MTPRAKLALCAGLLAVAVVAVGVVVAFRSPAKPVVEGRFVRYEQDGRAVLGFTNRGRSAVAFVNAFAGTNKENAVGVFDPKNIFRRLPPNIFTLHPQEGVQLDTGSMRSLPVTVSVVYVQLPESSGLRSRVETTMNRLGIYLRGRSFLATVNLPPRETNAPVQLVTP